MSELHVKELHIHNAGDEQTKREHEKDKTICVYAGMFLGLGIGYFVRVLTRDEEKNAVHNVTEDNYKEILNKALEIEKSMKKEDK